MKAKYLVDIYNDAAEQTDLIYKDLEVLKILQQHPYQGGLSKVQVRIPYSGYLHEFWVQHKSIRLEKTEIHFSEL